MRIDILTLFPGMFTGVLNESILGRAQEAGILQFGLFNIRDYSANKHHCTDDYPFGGGNGMVMMCQPVFDCLDAVRAQSAGRPHVIFLSPRGKTLTPLRARQLSQEEHLVLLCGHYEGLDERIMTQVDEELSIGDYVLTGGELPAMVLIDCVARFIPGVLGSIGSAEEESFNDGLLEYPQYTRPAEFRGMKVPEVLLSGHHANIAKWRRKQSILRTKQRRPDLYQQLDLSSKQDKKLLQELEDEGAL